MPEQLTRHPEVTLQVLRSAGARCGEGLAPAILTRCPPERFCRLPGGELCVYGLPEAGRMTQIGAADWRALAASSVPGAGRLADSGAPNLLAIGALGLLVGLVLGRMRARRRRDRGP
jgi:hypothetical protein